MDEKKTSVLALLKVLEENSDENHLLSQPELLRKLEEIYNVKLDRRTLYRNVEMLQDFGYDISDYKDNGQGYYLRERNFEGSEISLLCNAIHSSNFIPNNASKDLINKLLSTQSKYFKNDYKDRVFIENRNKKDNKDFFLNVEIISEAIKEKKCISFNYTKYNFKKELVNRREELYKCSPYYLVYNLDKAYLIGKSANHSDFTHFRIDRMKNVTITNDNYQRLSKKEDPYEYAKSKIYMYSGEKESIAIRCDSSMLDSVIDTFGKDITIIEETDDKFVAYVKSSKEGIVYYALQYLKHLEIVEPKELREEIAAILKEGAKKYK